MVRARLRTWVLAAAGVVLAALLPLSLSVPAAAASTTFGLGPQPAQIVCVNTTTCYVVGSESNTWGLTFTLTDGVASTPATVTSVFDIADIACTSTTACYGDGQIQLGGVGNFTGMVIPIASGSAGSPTQVGGTFSLNGIACVPGTTTCYAVGDSGNSSASQGEVVPITGGTAGAASAVAGTEYLSAIACPTASTCYAVGAGGGNGVVLPIDPATGRAGTVDVVSSTSALTGIACPTSSYCLAAGNGGTILPLTVSGTSITLGTAATVSGVADWSAVGCADSATCYAAGTNSGYNTGVFSIIRDGVPGPATPVNGTSFFTGVACPTAATCVFAGSDFVPYTFVGLLDTISRTATTLGASAPSVALNQPVTLTATVTPRAPATGTPTGTVDFYDGATLLGPGTLNQSNPDEASLTTSTLAQGPHSISAVYAGDDSFFNSAAPAVSVTVGKAGTTTTVATTPNPSQFGEAVTVAATVAPGAAGSGTPTGTVDFYDGSTEIGSTTLNQATPDVADIQTSALGVGTHAITATYGGDATFQGSTTAAAATQKVSQAATSTTVTPTPNPSQYGEAVTISATVTASAPGGGTPTGTVDFYDEGTQIGSGSLDQAAPDVATLQTSSLGVGTHTITAEYQGDASFQASPMSASVTQTVNQAATSISVSSDANPSVIGQPVTFTAQVSAGGSPVPAGSVTFYDGSTSLGTAGVDAAGSAALTTSTLTAGAHTITAAYGGSTDYLAGTSAGLAQTVNRASTTLTLTSAAVASAATCQAGRTGCDQDDNGHPGSGDRGGACNPTPGCDQGHGGHPGTPDQGGCGFGGSKGCEQGNGGHPGAPAQGGACASGFRGPHLTPGAFGTVSGAVYGIVQGPSGPDTSIACQAVTLTATVAAVPPATGAPTGTVTFTDGTTTLGSASLATTGGVTTASLTLASLPAGSQTITATYGGDATFQGSTATITQHVQYIFIGLLPPLSGGHAVDPNATVPVAFTLLNGAGQVVRDATATLSVDGQAPVPFRFRGDRYQYDLRLRDLAISGTTVDLSIQVSDGSTHTFTLTLAAPKGHGH